MDLDELCGRTRLVLVVGKGGVGRTTTAATLAVAVASSGRRALLLALDDRATLPALFGSARPLDHSEQLLYAEGSGEVRALSITSDAALSEYLDRHGLGRVARHLERVGALEVVATAIPGIREVLVLGKVRQLVDDDPADLVILDAPATGHALDYLRSAAGLLRIARSGPLRDQAQRVTTLLSAGRSEILLVTLAEETPVNECVETAYRLEDELDCTLTGIVVNALVPERAGLSADEVEDALRRAPCAAALESELRRAATLRRARAELEARERARLRAELALPQVGLERRPAAELGPDDLRALARELTVGLATW